MLQNAELCEYEINSRPFNSLRLLAISQSAAVADTHVTKQTKLAIQSIAPATVMHLCVLPLFFLIGAH